jgi:signal transduction histidine kinase
VKSGEIFLEIRDKGRGLAASKPASDANETEELIETGVGISGMRERLRQLGGRLEIDPNIEGTTITAVVRTANGGDHVANPSRGRS